MSAIEDIAAERRRQVEAEGWTPEHDDAHVNGELAQAAAAYAYESDCADTDGADLVTRPHWWPWSREWWKPKNRRNMLIKAGALIVAEIERLDRMPKPSVEE